MEGPSGVVALVLAETAAGGAAVLWLSGLWGRVKRGFFVLTAATILVVALLAAVAASGALRPGNDAARVGVLLSAGAATLLGMSLALLILRAERAGRMAGLVAVPVSVAALVAFAGSGSTSVPVAVLQLVAGAAFMGAVTDGLLLGHWYLVDRRLPRDHIQRYAVLLLLTVALEAVAVLLGLGGRAPATTGFSPLLSVGSVATWVAVGMVACTGLIAVMIRASLRTPRARAVQAATGFFYLAVVTAFAGEMAAKVRFLG